MSPPAEQDHGPEGNEHPHEGWGRILNLIKDTPVLRTTRDGGVSGAGVAKARVMEERQNPFDQMENKTTEQRRAIPIRGKQTLSSTC